ncbi:urea transporter [Paenibacillus elgii]|uniref:urea transporter n=1 Tax=Paenibacillus elgii TaxID=189691 RepID=UPI003079DE27
MTILNRQLQADALNLKWNPVPFILASFKGVSQVILIENAWTGLIIVIALATVHVKLGVIALLSAMIGTLVGYLGGADKSVVHQGLFGFNAVLTGLGLSVFLTANLATILGAAALGTLCTAAFMHLFKRTNIPVLTFPYTVVTWLFLLASYHLNALRLDPGLIPQDLAHWHMNTAGKIDLASGLLNGIDQVYFQTGFLSGILILLGIFWASWRLGLLAVLGTAIAWPTAYLMGAEITNLNLGIFGYNAVLTMMAVSSVFHTRERPALLVGLLAAVSTVPVTAGLNTWFQAYGMPTLTLPFVIVTWIFLGARQVLPKL